MLSYKCNWRWACFDNMHQIDRAQEYYRSPSINAQCQSIPIKFAVLVPMPINKDQMFNPHLVY